MYVIRKILANSLYLKQYQTDACLVIVFDTCYVTFFRYSSMNFREMCQNPLKCIKYIFVSFMKYMANAILFNNVIMLTTWNLKIIANCDYYSSHINLRFWYPNYRNHKFYLRLWTMVHLRLLYISLFS